MHSTVSEDFAQFLSDQVSAGRYKDEFEAFADVSQIVDAEREKWKALKAKLDAAVERGGSNTSEEVLASVEASLEKLNLPNA